MMADTHVQGDDTIEPELVALARRAQTNAHVPYSGFRVGAALRTTSGAVFAGCNVENAAYPEGMCAEASAIAAMASAGERVIEVIVTVCDGAELATCCGGCRQKIREFATGATVVHNAGPGGVLATFTMDEILPVSFGPHHLIG